MPPSPFSSQFISQLTCRRLPTLCTAGHHSLPPCSLTDIQATWNHSLLPSRALNGPNFQTIVHTLPYIRAVFKCALVSTKSSFKLVSAHHQQNMIPSIRFPKHQLGGPEPVRSSGLFHRTDTLTSSFLLRIPRRHRSRIRRNQTPWIHPLEGERRCRVLITRPPGIRITHPVGQRSP